MWEMALTICDGAEADGAGETYLEHKKIKSKIGTHKPQGHPFAPVAWRQTSMEIRLQILLVSLQCYNQNLQLCHHILLDSKMLVLKIVTDIFSVVICATPLLIFRFFGYPPVRGFFCDDESIRYPYKGSTVSSLVMSVVGYGLPVSVIVVTEVLLAIKKSADAASPLLCGKEIPLWLIRCYNTLGVFFFGAICTILITYVSKFTTGRLRPHFMQVCNPDVDCSSANRTFITNYTCRGSYLGVKAARLSFPSGHASFSSYVMMYLVFYIQNRVFWLGSSLLKHTAQLCCFLMAWATALSRINDNKHHWSDVTVGLILGTTIAVISALLSMPFPGRNTPPSRSPSKTKIEVASLP